MQIWSPHSWQTFSNAQPVAYDSHSELEKIVEFLNHASPLVAVDKINALSALLRQVAEAKAFIFQAGECAERFVDAEPMHVQMQLKLINELDELLAQHLKKNIVTIGRIAGQYAKPRTLAFEKRDGLELPNYRGDLINAIEFDAKSRRADPQRMCTAYTMAKKTLALLEAHFPHIYTSHEVLHLAFEQSLTREFSGRYYNTATHFPWVGLRTAYPESAHIEYVSGLANPIALKVGSKLKADALKALVYKLNPLREPGRLSLIHRLGAEEIDKILPSLILAVQETQTPVLWICDPMHGNTQRTKEGCKFRSLKAIAFELERALQIHSDLGSYLGGVHLELTSYPVQECVEDIGSLEEYQPTYVVDPRLNGAQAKRILQVI